MARTNEQFESFLAVARTQKPEQWQVGALELGSPTCCILDFVYQRNTRCFVGWPWAVTTKIMALNDESGSLAEAQEKVFGYVESLREEAK